MKGRKEFFRGTTLIERRLPASHFTYNAGSAQIFDLRLKKQVLHPFLWRVFQHLTPLSVTTGHAY